MLDRPAIANLVLQYKAAPSSPYQSATEPMNVRTPPFFALKIVQIERLTATALKRLILNQARSFS